MEGEDSVRTVQCLRGRLLAERVASRNAKEAAEIWENKLIELEKMLEQETQSRNRAEKKLRLLIKKLESFNTPHVSDESERSGLVDKSDFSSLKSSAVSSSSLSTTETQETTEKQQFIISLCENQETEFNNGERTIISEVEANVSEPRSQESVTSISDESEVNIVKDTLCSNEENSGNCYRSLKHYDKEGLSSMALVPVHVAKETTKIDPQVLDENVKEVLETLKRAKESLQSSMLRRCANMIRVG